MDPVLFGVFTVGLFAGFINVIVGSGSTIMIPILIILGFPPHVAVATNRFAMIFNNGTGAVAYYRAGYLNVTAAVVFSVFAAIGAPLGALVVLKTPPQAIVVLVAVVLVAEAAFVFFFRDRLGAKERAFALTRQNVVLGAIAGFAVGLYGGFLGMAITTMLMFVFVAAFAFTMLQSAAVTKVLTLVISVAATGIFILSSKVDFVSGAVLVCAYVIGGYLGVRSAIAWGDRRVSMLFVAVATLSAGKLLLDIV